MTDFKANLIGVLIIIGTACFPQVFGTIWAVLFILWLIGIIICWLTDEK